MKGTKESVHVCSSSSTETRVHAFGAYKKTDDMVLGAFDAAG